jgi:hypothetical protein
MHSPADEAGVRAGYAIGGMIAAFLLALPLSAEAQGGGQVQRLAAQQCKQERTISGKRAFRKKYGPKHTMRTCIKRTRPHVGSVLDPAVQQCQAELAESGPTEFLDDYLDDDVGSVDDAMVECVAETVDELLTPDDYVDDGEIDDE